MAGSGVTSLLKTMLAKLRLRNSSSCGTFSSVGGYGRSLGRLGDSTAGDCHCGPLLCRPVGFCFTAALIMVSVWVW